MIAPDGRFQFRIVEIKDILYSLFKGIDDRISRYINGIFRDISFSRFRLALPVGAK